MVIFISFRGRRVKGDVPPRKIIVERSFINMIFAYSAKKNKAKGPPAYSTLYPETNSDSPSVKSKGVRFVSARVDTYHMYDKGRQDSINHLFC